MGLEIGSKIIKAYKLEDLVKVDLQLTPEEQEELSIQWHVSDILYFEKKQEALKVCKEAGLDLEKKEITIRAGYANMVEDCTRVILSALRYKSESDLAVVSIAAPNNLRRYTGAIIGRTRFEYYYYLENFRVALYNCKRTYFDMKNESRIVRDTQIDLEKLNKGFEGLVSEIPRVQTNSEIYIRAREMVRSND